MQNQLQTIDSTAGLEISMSPAIVSMSGAKRKDRIARVLRDCEDAPTAALALIGEKGDLGKLSRETAAKDGVVSIIHRCSLSDYRAFAVWLGLQLDKSVIIRNRAEYMMQSYMLERDIMDLRGKGTAAANKKADALLTIQQAVLNVQNAAQEMFEKRIAERKARAEELANEMAAEAEAETTMADAAALEEVAA